MMIYSFLKKHTNKFIILCFLIVSLNYVELTAQKRWVGTWGCAPYAAANNTPPSPYLQNNTLRQIVRVSIGGDTLRLKLSNITSSTSTIINAVSIAELSEIGGSAIDSSTLKMLMFNGSESVVMNAYSEAISDPLAYNLSSGTQLAVSIFYGEIKNAADMTHHYGSRTNSYLLAGNQAKSVSFSGAIPVERWYTVNTIEVLVPDTCANVIILGNSITDGYGIHNGQEHTWPDVFSEKLINNKATSHIGVLNMGIGATWVTTSGIGRFNQDVLNQNGLRWIIVFYGVNDIGGGASADKIIKAYQSMIAQAHNNNVRIYGATITPFKGHGYYSTEREAVRQEVNQWIRTPGNFDECIDFDIALRDPSDPERMIEAYSNDWLHPNIAGYKFLGEFVDLNLF